MGTERGQLRKSGMGGFLNPPGHPEHEWSVEIDLRRRPENRGSMSLTAATESEWLTPATRAAARRKLAEWQPLPLTDPAVRKWVASVMNYFRGCFKNTSLSEEEAWNASKLVIDRTRPVDDEHAGVRLIRKYYPDFKLTDVVVDETAPWGRESGKEEA